MIASSDHPEDLFHCLEDGQTLRHSCYRGRFAPSPSGPLHLGNLRTALFSWLRARMNGGEWLLRFDDLDTPRNRSGAVESIQKDLLWLGLVWDGPIIFQSQRLDIYNSILSFLKSKDSLYACRCSRSLLSSLNPTNKLDFVYPGKCRNLGLPWISNNGKLLSLRLKVGKHFSRICGDVIVRRADGFIAYHLATVVDELALGINEVVRGQDLLQAKFSQLALIEALALQPLNYLHVPLWTKADGTKLSKREGSEGLIALQASGLKPSNVIGLLASSLNLVPKGAELSVQELLSETIKRKNVFEKAFSC